MHLPPHPSARRFVPFAAVLPRLASVARLAPIGLLAAAACATSAPEPLFEESGELTAAAAPGILSAYLGAVDQALIPFCPTLPVGAVLEGLPVVFNRQIYNPSLRADRFLVTSSTGAQAVPSCATLAPAGEENEDNTVLLVGDFVSGGATVAAVSATGLYAEGADAATRGEAFGSLIEDDVIPVSRSVWLIAAQVPADPQLADCPATTPPAVQVVRATWTGGLRPLAASVVPLVSVRDGGGAPLPVTGIPAGEEDDNDNILDVCLASAARPAAITVAAGAYTAPNGLPTTATTIAIE